MDVSIGNGRDEVRFLATMVNGADRVNLERENGMIRSEWRCGEGRGQPVGWPKRGLKGARVGKEVAQEAGVPNVVPLTLREVW